MADDNLRIWNAVSKTDPAHTKKVEFGRKFTSIDAHWQVMQATKQFGPIGQGWGYTVVHGVERLSEAMVLAIADVTLWWRDDKVAQYGPVRATCEMWSPDKSGKMRVDEDAPKKAMTDALTKGLSHLGFSADVFLGLFDDNRYVQKVTREFAMADPAQEDVLAGARRWVSDQAGVLSTFSIRADVIDWNRRNAKALQKLQRTDEDLYAQVMKSYDAAFRRTDAPLQ